MAKITHAPAILIPHLCNVISQKGTSQRASAIDNQNSALTILSEGLYCMREFCVLEGKKSAVTEAAFSGKAHTSRTNGLFSKHFTVAAWPLNLLCPP